MSARNLSDPAERVALIESALDDLADKHRKLFKKVTKMNGINPRRAMIIIEKMLTPAVEALRTSAKLFGDDISEDAWSRPITAVIAELQRRETRDACARRVLK